MLGAKEQILVVDDETNLRRVLAAQLAREGYDVHEAANGQEALAFLKEHHVDLVVSDLRMPVMSGLELLRSALRLDPQLPVIILTAHGTVDNAVEALKTGAFDYMSKPFDQEEVRTVVRKALRTRQLAARDATAQDQTPLATTEATTGATNDAATKAKPESTGVRFGIIGASSAIQELYAMIDRVADTPTTVLVTGESGTGKELVARALHDQSSRRDRPFIKVNCAAIPTTLIESELFGHEKGAFTGAVGAKPGRFELASGGTLFLDEIGEVPLEMQVKLLRVLQESEFERVGGVKTIKVDVRLVAATNRNLKQRISDGHFREDLFYRLNVVPLGLVSLRERAEDIPRLVEYFIERNNERLHKSIVGVDDGAIAAMLSHRWPGNIRELENVVERAVLFADGDRIVLGDLPEELRRPTPTPQTPAVDSGAPLEDGEGLKARVKAATLVLERELIQRALKQTEGNVTHAARLLKISRKGLQLKMKELDLRD